MGESTVRMDRPLGWWWPDGANAPPGAVAVNEALRQVLRPFALVQKDGALAVAQGGVAQLGGRCPAPTALPIQAYVPACPLDHLGDPEFSAALGTRFPCLAGSMAHGIASVPMVEALGRAGLLAFFGSGGLPLKVVESALDQLAASLGRQPYGVNVLAMPHEPDKEQALVDLVIHKGVRLIEASAFVNLSPALVRYRVGGLYRDGAGNVVAPHRLIAKVSRVEVAEKFLSPPPERLLHDLVLAGAITAESARLAGAIAMADALTAEADSGGHTDKQPAVSLLPTMLALRDRLRKQYGLTAKLWVGAAGGMATPNAVAAAYAMGAAYVMTGSANQACVESGTSDLVRDMLAQAQQADVAMTVSTDMFEAGAKVQVLKRGSLFPMRASKLYELYRGYAAIDEIPAAELAQIEKSIFRAPVAEIWRQTVEYFKERDPAQIAKAEANPKHKMALLFKWYLGQATSWAMRGIPDRKVDYQIWCGPAMGAFNEWVKGSFLEAREQRRVVTVAMNLMHGAAVISRANLLRIQGITLAPEWINPAPLELSDLLRYCAEQEENRPAP